MLQRLGRVCSLALLALLGSSPLRAAEPYLVKDINPVAENPSSNPRDFISLDNGIALFIADVEAGDPELWRSDGTAAGTYRLTDTCAPEGCPSPPVRFVATAGDRAFYVAATGSVNSADQLWVTGGSPENTFHLAGPLSINTRAPTVWLEERGVLLFSAEDDQHRGELWRSDGTPAGTYRLSPEGVFPGELTEFRGKLYFFLYNSRGASLWTSDGTARGTKLVKNFPGFATRMKSIGSALVFFGPGATLWRSDGTPRGTVPISTIDRSGRLPLWEVVALGGRYYFTTDVQGQGEELWASDGTRAGTRRVTNFTPLDVFFYEFPNGREALPLPELAAGSRMVFTVDDGVHGVEPWTTDGTPAGTRLLRDICPGPCSSNPAERATVGPRLIFSANDGVHGQVPWVTDGTPAGTRILRNIGWHPFQQQASTFNGRLFFAGSDARFGLQIWKTDGTPRGTRRVTTFPPEESRLIRLGTPAGGALLYAAQSPAGVELWRTDGTARGTWMVLDLYDQDVGGSRPAYLTPALGRLFFAADDGLHGRELWTSDGSEAGTFLVQDSNPPGNPPDPYEILDAAEMGGRLFLLRNGGNGLWRTDGTNAGTFRLNPEEVQPYGWLRATGNRIFFKAADPEHGTELWVSDGTAAGARVIDLAPGTGSTPFNEAPAVFQGRLHFGANGYWTSDGTTEGTVLVPFLPSPGKMLGEHGGRLWFMGSTSQGYSVWGTNGTEAGTTTLEIPDLPRFEMDQLVSAGSRMFLLGAHRTPGLWVSDGTTAGTHRVGSVVPFGAGVSLNGRLFFIGWHGEDLAVWVSDGTEAGTEPLRRAGQPFLGVSELVVHAGRVWFSSEGRLWQTDGTPAGTSEAGPGGSDLTAAGSRLFFSRWDPTTGAELWAVEP